MKKQKITAAVSEKKVEKSSDGILIAALIFFPILLSISTVFNILIRQVWWPIKWSGTYVFIEWILMVGFTYVISMYIERTLIERNTRLKEIYQPNWIRIVIPLVIILLLPVHLKSLGGAVPIIHVFAQNWEKEIQLQGFAAVVVNMLGYLIISFIYAYLIMNLSAQLIQSRKIGGIVLAIGGYILLVILHFSFWGFVRY
jgi:hypothetical protein